MSLLRLDGLCADVGDRRLFGPLDAAVETRTRIALVGPNGAGKSTLLSMMAGRLAPSAGAVHRASGLRVAVVAQDASLPEGATVWEVARSAGGGEIPRLEARLRTLEAGMAENAALLAEYGETLERYEHLDGYAWEARVREHLAGVGLGAGEHALRPGQISGGQRMRLALAHALLSDPDLLLLDEPTNHLDLAGIRWLEDTLGRLKGSVVFVSHDRAFLRHVATATWGFTPLGFFAFGGGYDAFRAEVERRMAEGVAQQAAESARRAELEAFVRKWSAGTRSRQAKDRQRKLDRLGPARTLPARRRAMRLRLGAPAGQRLQGLVLERVSASFGQRVLWRDLDLTLPQGARLGVVGPNGCGKSTLLRLLAGEIAPAAGSVRWSDDSRVGWLRQSVEVEGETVLDAVMRLTGMTRFEARRRLADGLFDPGQMDTPVAALSGGERTRLGLVVLSVEGANVLLLDEPTNHLDVEAQEALEQVLSAYSGTLIAVSHDRTFLAATTDRWLVFDDEGPPRLVATVPDGTRPTAPRRSEAIAAPRVDQGGASELRRPPGSRPASAIRRSLASLEDEIALDEQERRALEALFSGPFRSDMAELQRTYADLGARLEQAYARWVELSAELEASS